MNDIRALFADHYKAERNRAEDCLGDIIKILQVKDADESARLDQILDRMIRHYQRDNTPVSNGHHQTEAK